MESIYDRIVIGAGITGSFTAYHLAKSGYKTLLLEQFAVPHNNGSSSGYSRITRKAYEQDFYANMMEEAFKTWSEVEDQTKETIYIQTGSIEIEARPYHNLKKQMKNMDRLKMPYKILEHEEFCEKYPQLKFPKGTIGLMDPAGGILCADKALKSVLKVFKDHGGTLIDDCTVTSIEPGVIVNINTTIGQFKARSIIVCSGPWSKRLLLTTNIDIPLQPEKIWVYYWEEKNPGELSVASGFPCFRTHRTGDFYFLPSMEYPGQIKFSRHNGIAYDENYNPEDLEVDPMVDEIIDMAVLHLPCIKPVPVRTEFCKYTVTPDHICVMDYHPKYKNIVIGTGFSGTGFKIAPTVGRILCDLSNNKDPGNDMKPFSIKRFTH